MTKLYRIVLNDHEMKVLDKALETASNYHDIFREKTNQNNIDDLRAYIKRQADALENQEEGF